MQVSVKSDIKKLTKALSTIQRKQIPFATSKALNATAFDARKSVQTALDLQLDKPTAYTKRGVQVEKSTKKNLVAQVGFRSRKFGKGQGSITQAEYMQRQIAGGTRLPKGQAIPVPVPKNMKPNKFGNIPRGKIDRLLADKDKYFSGVPKGRNSGAGIWQRMPANSKRKKQGGKIRMVIAYEPKAQYQPRFRFKSVVEKSVKQNFGMRFNSAMKQALASAR
jgi:hypothetical protein